MAQNKIPPELQKLMAQMPNVGFDKLSDQPLDLAAATPAPVQVESAPMEGASQFNVPDPALPQTPTLSSEPSVGDTIMGNLASSRMGKWLGGMETYPMKDGKIDRTAGTPVFPSIREATEETPFGNEVAPEVATPDTSVAPPDIAVETPSAGMATPESVAGLSITGTPLTQDAITSPQLPQPQVPTITTPAPAAGQLSGMITRDSTGQQFGLNEGGNLRELNPTEGAALQGDLDRRRAAREAQVMQTFGQMTPEQLTEQRQIGAKAAYDRLSPAEKANVDAGRPPNVSAGQVGQAQQEAVARQADYEQRQVNNRIDSDVKQFKRDNPRATPEQVAMHRQQLIQQESLAGKEEGQGGMTFEQNLAREKLNLDKAKFADSVVSRGEEAAPLTPAQKEFAKKSGEGAFDWDQGGRASAQENIGKFQTVLTDLEDGNLDTRTLVEFAPFVGDWARSAVNPTGQQGLDTIRGVIFQGLRDTLGAQFTEREGERLVSASYNPKLDEASNVARLKPALARMRETFQAKEALTQHILNGGSVADYQGKTPWEVYKAGGGAASQGSPIEGDVDDRSLDDALL